MMCHHFFSQFREFHFFEKTSSGVNARRTSAQLLSEGAQRRVAGRLVAARWPVQPASIVRCALGLHDVEVREFGTTSKPNELFIAHRLHGFEKDGRGSDARGADAGEPRAS